MSAAALAVAAALCAPPRHATTAAAATTVSVSVSDTAAILSKHAAYVGHPQGLVLKYRFTPSPKATPTPTPAPTASPLPSYPPYAYTVYRRGALYREVGEGSGVTRQDGFTGRAFWSSNMNGYTVINYEKAARRALTSNLVDGDLLGADVPATSRGTQKIDGIDAEVVRITPVNGIPADVAFDRATGGYVQITYEPDDPYEKTVVHVDGYTEVAPGIRVPAGYRRGTGEYGSEKLVEKAVRTVTNEDLRGPVPTATWNFASVNPAPIEVKKYAGVYGFGPGGGAVYVKASIDGHAGTFLLDSGSSDIIIYRPYADKLKLTMLGPTAFGGIAGGSVRARFARASSIDVGANRLSNVIVTVAGGRFSGDIDGILGYDFLAGALVDVDTANQTIRFLNPEQMQPVVARGAHAFPVNLADFVPEINVNVNGVATHPIFDTGNSSFFTLSEDLRNTGKIVALTDSVRVGNNQVEYSFFFYGVDGPVPYPEKCSRLTQVEIGPYKYQGVETCFALAKVFGRDGGLIGFDFLKHFNWTFDYPESKLVLTPNGK